jgi:hypothetical protein
MNTNDRLVPPLLIQLMNSNMSIADISFPVIVASLQF